MKVCKFDGCNRKHDARGVCGTHYKRWVKAGKPSDWDGGPPIGVLAPKPCMECGVMMQPRGNRQWRCKSCSATAQLKQRKCSVCGQVFKTTVHNKLTCGAECARKRARLSVCKFDGCGRSAHARGMCSTHHSRWTKLGRPENWDGGPPIGAVIPKRPEEHVDWDAFFQRLERNAGPRTAALARFELRRQRQRRAESEARA